MQIFNRTALTRIVLITAVLFSIFFLISAISPDLDARELLLGKSPALIALLVLAVVLHFLFEPLRWYAYVLQGDTRGETAGTGFVPVFAVLSATALLSYSLPFKLGLPTRIYLIREYLGLASQRIIFFLTVDGVISIATWAVFGAASFVYLLPRMVLPSAFVYVVAGMIVLLLLLFFARRLVRKLLQPLRSREFSISSRAFAFCTSVLVLDVVGYGLRHVAIFLFLGIPVGYIEGFLIGVLSVFAGIASTLPLGLGAYDGALVFLLAAQGISLELAGMAPIINRTLNVLSSVVFGALGSALLVRRSAA